MIVEAQSYFYLHGGGVLRDMEELLNALKTIDDDVFNFHVSSEKNDFSNWVRFVLKDKFLADKLVSLKTREEMVKAIEKRLITVLRMEKRKGIIQQIKVSHHE